MNTVVTPGPLEPYNDFDYLEAETAWVRAKCVRIATTMKAERDAERPAGLASAENGGLDTDVKQQIDRLAAREDDLRNAIDARLQVTRAAGVELGFDALLTEFDADEIDRVIILLPTLPALGFEIGQILGEIAALGFAMMSITPETLAIFCGLDLAGRIDLRRRLGPTGKLVKGGVVAVDLPRSEQVQDFPAASVYIQPAAFRQIVGLDDPGEPVCFACGQAIQPRSSRKH